MKRIDENGPDALLQLRELVNKLPDFVRYIVQRLKTLSPSMGKLKIAETLCRARPHLGITTVGRILKEEPRPDTGSAAPCTDVVTAKRPNHVWHVDHIEVATSVGFWAPWLPFALPQRWPFCWWVAAVIDHHSRRAMGIAIVRNNPTSVSIHSFLESAIVNLLGHKSGRITTHYSAAEFHNLLEAADKVSDENSRKSPALTILNRKAE